MRFITAFNRVRAAGEVNAGPVLVDTAGYVPARKLIESYLRAGRNLAASRAAGEYDFAAGEPVDETFEDCTREVGIDYGDIAVLAAQTFYNLNAAREAAEAAAREAAEVSLQAAATEAVDDVPR